MSQPGISRLAAAAADLLDDAIRSLPKLEGAAVVGIGWATVEIERAERELGGVLGPDGRWEAAKRDGLLGATARLWRSAAGTPPLILVLEPDTEGRLAAFLARHAEGVAALYVAARAGAAFPPGALSRSSPGPLGPARRVTRRGPGDASILVLAQHSVP